MEVSASTIDGVRRAFGFAPIDIETKKLSPSASTYSPPAARDDVGPGG